ncbi:hypothetical protein OHQ88_34305 (plasmid) [Micromonospora zamorensis]|uniref:hypothetical protein n=1 Tax=Micromonospora zamorensis TaxID=709883 RepID=UPI002E1FF965
MTQPHEDPFDDSRRQLLQGLAALATPVEALARLYAANKSRQADELNSEARRDRAVAGTERKAEQLTDAVQAERQRMASRIDGSWLKEATFAEAADAWRTATAWAAANDPVGKKVAGMALDRLSELDPQWKAAYDRHRAAGMPGWEAVRTAAYETAEREMRSANGPEPSPTARAHPGRGNQHALPAAGTRVAVDDFRWLAGAVALDAAVRDEVRTLASNLSPEAVREFQQYLRSINRIPPVGDLELLYTFAAEAGKAMPTHKELTPAEDLRRWAEAKGAADRAGEAEGLVAREAGTPDDRRTVVDEHSQGLDQAGHHAGVAEHARATAAQLGAGGQQARMRAAFPVELVVGGTVPTVVAGKQPANSPARTRGLTR